MRTKVYIDRLIRCWRLGSHDRYIHTNKFLFYDALHLCLPLLSVESLVEHKVGCKLCQIFNNPFESPRTISITQYTLSLSSAPPQHLPRNPVLFTSGVEVACNKTIIPQKPLKYESKISTAFPKRRVVSSAKHRHPPDLSILRLFQRGKACLAVSFPGFVRNPFQHET